MPVRVTIVVLAVLALVCGPAAAGLVNQQVKVGLHIEPHEDRSCSKNMPVIDDREDFTNFWLQVTYPCDFDVFVVIFSFDEIAGVEFGLDWPGEWGSAWYTFNCADHKIGQIRNPGDWSAMTWIECQSGLEGQVYLPAAWAWLTATGPGELSIVPGPSHYTMVASCRADGWQASIVESVFYAGIGTIPYMGPPQVATEPTTWGSIKAMFR